MRMLIDSGAVDAGDVVLIGARNLDPPEEEFIASTGMAREAGGIEPALEGTEGVYVAVDCDCLEPGEVASFMPEPGGLALAEVEELVRDVAARRTVLGAGFSGLAPEERNVEPLTRLSAALGL